jgi:hypothetical protein
MNDGSLGRQRGQKFCPPLDEANTVPEKRGNFGVWSS